MVEWIDCGFYFVVYRFIIVENCLCGGGGFLRGLKLKYLCSCFIIFSRIFSFGYVRKKWFIVGVSLCSDM